LLACERPKSEWERGLGSTGVLINPLPYQEGNKLMFVSEWREFPSAPCLAGGGGMELGDSLRLDVVEIARVPDMLLS